MSNETTLQQLLQALVKHHEEGNKIMQNLVAAISALQVAPASNISNAVAAPAVSVSLSEPEPEAKVESSSDLSLPCYVLDLSTRRNQYKCAMYPVTKKSSISDQLPRFDISMNIAHIMIQVPSEPIKVYVPFIKNGKFCYTSSEDSNDVPLFQYSKTIRMNRLPSREEIMYLMCLNVLSTLVERMEDKDLCATTESKFAQRQLLSFGLLTFMYLLRVSQQNKERFAPSFKQETEKILWFLLRHVQQSWTYELSGESTEPLFGASKHSNSLQDVCEDMFKAIFTEIRDNRWLWVIVCAFSFPFSYKYRTFPPIFSLDNKVIHWIQKDSKVVHARDTLSRVKCTVEDPSKRIDVCMEAIQSRTDETFAVLMWNQIGYLHLRLDHMRGTSYEFHNMSLRPLVQINVKNEMRNYMMTYEAKEFKEASSIKGWIQWLHIIEKICSHPQCMIKWSWINPSKDGNITDIRFIEEAKHLFNRLQTVHHLSRDSVSIPPNFHLIDITASHPTLKFVINHLYKYGPVNILIPSLYQIDEISYDMPYTKLVTLLLWFEQAQETKDDKCFDLLMDYGMKWYQHKILCMLQTQNANVPTILFTIIPILRVIAKHPQASEKMNTHSGIWSRIYNEFMNYEAIVKTNTWGSVQDKTMIVLEPTNDSCEKIQRLVSIGLEKYDPWITLSEQDQLSIYKTHCLLTQFDVSAPKRFKNSFFNLTKDLYHENC